MGLADGFRLCLAPARLGKRLLTRFCRLGLGDSFQPGRRLLTRQGKADSFWLGEDEYRKEKVPLLPKRAKTDQDKLLAAAKLPLLPAESDATKVAVKRVQVVAAKGPS